VNNGTTRKLVETRIDRAQIDMAYFLARTTLGSLRIRMVVTFQVHTVNLH